MDFRTTYGTLLKTQIDMYARMFDIMEKMEEMEKYGSKDTPPRCDSTSNVHMISSCTIQLERLAVQLDETFEKANESMERIEHMSELCQQLVSHPVYMRILELHILAEARVHEFMKNR